ncbi:tetratricopeptide repeat protein [Sphingomonas sp.]|uniref:tetratricopeptide repeat protein n=1 Tax=Sphingomonas sp. TaxID=28214 RepID=UPI0017A468DB|nr:tetratricopeptide repeat protein [Sphingomonas sp.]MBA3510685.1 tetratricopeptide repeat protein [Sphingomonas sp.]
MKSTLTNAPLALAAAALAGAPASAQYNAPPPPRQEIPAAAQSPGPERTIDISRQAAKALQELQAAVESNDVANIPARLAAAQAVARTADEKYFVARMQLKAATQSKDQAAIAAAIEAMLASGGLEPAKITAFTRELGNIHFKNKDYSKAAAAFERVLAGEPNNADALALLAETKNSQGQASQAAGLMQRAISAKSAGGQKAEENWYKRAIAIAYQAQLPSAMELSRQWVAAYPSPASWRDALRIYRKLAKPDELTTLDTLRLARATGALEGDADFHVYAFTAAENAAAGEARAVVDEAVAARQIDPGKPLFKDIIATLRADRSMTRESLPELTRNALADPAARLAVRTGDALYGYGEYAKAAELYRAALSKSGADTSLINLHLGMALARAGDKAGATAALNAVTGPRAELAKYWLVYVAART